MQAELSETSEFTKCSIPADFVTLVPVFPSLFFFFKSILLSNEPPFSFSRS